jgi:hypothetical protein
MTLAQAQLAAAALVALTRGAEDLPALVACKGSATRVASPGEPGS